MAGTSDILHEMFSLQGRVALVTGASGGIGRALAVALARAGAKVALHGRSAQQLEAARREIEGCGAQSIVVAAELGQLDDCNRLISATVAELGGLDVLVNCAGMNRRKPIEQATPEDFDTIVGVNLRAVYFLSQAAHRTMRIRGGKIVHVASLTSFMGLGGTSVYGMTKAALSQLCKTQAVEWAKDNIQVNCLAPGFIQTPLTEPLWNDARRRDWLLGRIPAKRAGLPNDMVATLLLLAGPGSAYLTGQTIAVDGGVLAGGSWDD